MLPEHDVAALARAVRQPRMQPRVRLGVDDRAELAARDRGRPDDERARRFHEPLDDRVVHALDADQPAGGRALLAGEAEGRAIDRRNGLVEIGVGVDDDRRSCRPSRR